MLAERLGLTPGQAFTVLREHARRHQEHLSELSRAVVTGTDHIPR